MLLENLNVACITFLLRFETSDKLSRLDLLQLKKNTSQIPAVTERGGAVEYLLIYTKRINVFLFFGWFTLSPIQG